MPFRFRKIFSLGKGMRLNLSKGGISSSIGKPGATLNIGKRGIRPTVGVPGSGVSYTPSTGAGAASQKQNSLVTLIVFIISCVLIVLISVCCIGVIFMEPDGSSVTPTAENSISIDQIIGLTSNAAQAQTLAVSSPIATSTLNALPASSPIPQSTLAPTWTPAPTNTPFVLQLAPGSTVNAGECVCNQDVYNCGDALALTCFETCNAQGAGDIHKLDQNNNGVACENN